MKNKRVDKDDIILRLKSVQGHLKKVISMVEDDKYCIDILQQSIAVQNALKKVDQLFLDRHFHCCVTKAFSKNRSEKSIQELLKIFKKINK